VARGAIRSAGAADLRRESMEHEDAACARAHVMRLSAVDWGKLS
jgi:hypothetical protein